MTGLEIDGLCVDARDSGLRLVDGMDLTVRAGEVLALVGESGSGKSVTARAIMRLDRGVDVSGSIRLGGTELVGLPERRMRQLRGSRMGMVFQDPLRSLNPVQRIGVQVTEPLRLRGVGRAEARRRAVEVLEDMKVPRAAARLDAYPHELSGGLRQRVALAMALIAEPDLLIADEPTTALDVVVQRRVLELLRESAHARGVAVILITHDMGVVAEAADRVSVMYGGRPVEHGSVERVFARPRHPYTAGLLGSVPRIDVDQERLTAIPGTAVAPRDRPAGCVFAARCPLREDACSGGTVPVVGDARDAVACLKADAA